MRLFDAMDFCIEEAAYLQRGKRRRGRPRNWRPEYGAILADIAENPKGEGRNHQSETPPATAEPAPLDRAKQALSTRKAPTVLR